VTGGEVLGDEEGKQQRNMDVKQDKRGAKKVVRKEVFSGVFVSGGGGDVADSTSPAGLFGLPALAWSMMRLPPPPAHLLPGLAGAAGPPLATTGGTLERLAEVPLLDSLLPITVFSLCCLLW
jgi:hypothetical protein